MTITILWIINLALMYRIAEYRKIILTPYLREVGSIEMYEEIELK